MLLFNNCVNLFGNSYVITFNKERSAGRNILLTLYVLITALMNANTKAYCLLYQSSVGNILVSLLHIITINPLYFNTSQSFNLGIFLLNKANKATIHSIIFAVTAINSIMVDPRLFVCTIIILTKKLFVCHKL